MWLVVSGHTPLCPAGAPSGSQDKLIAWVGLRSPRLATAAFRVASNQLRKHPKFVLHKVSEAGPNRITILCNPAYYSALNQTLLEATRRGPEGIVTDVTLLGNDSGYRFGDLPPASVSFWARRLRPDCSGGDGSLLPAERRRQ